MVHHITWFIATDFKSPVVRYHRCNQLVPSGGSQHESCGSHHSYKAFCGPAFVILVSVKKEHSKRNDIQHLQVCCREVTARDHTRPECSQSKKRAAWFCQALWRKRLQAVKSRVYLPERRPLHYKALGLPRPGRIWTVDLRPHLNLVYVDRIVFKIEDLNTLS